MNAPQFETLLTTEAFERYTVARVAFRWIFVEVRGKGDRFARQLSNDMVHFEELRSAIAASLSSSKAEQSAYATKWSTFLKPRIETLDYWASLTGALGAAAVSLFVVVALLAGSGKSVDYQFILLGTMVGVLAGILKFEIDRRRLWYKYLVSHLEAMREA